MSLKTALLASAVWTIVAVVVSAVAIWYVMAHPVAGASVEQRSQMLGSGVGTVMAIGYGAIWLPFAFKLGQERRAAQAAKARQKKPAARKRPQAD